MSPITYEEYQTHRVHGIAGGPSRGSDLDAAHGEGRDALGYQEASMADRQANYPPIEDYGAIGNCHTLGLVNSQGSLDWLCLPRFDSPAIFARILDVEKGGAWAIQPVPAFHSRHQYRPDTNVLETTFTTEEGRVRLVDCMAISASWPRAAKVQPVLIRLLEGIDGAVAIESVCTPRPDYAREMPVFEPDGRSVSFGPFTLAGPRDWEVDEEQGRVACRVTVRAGERIAFTLYGIEGDASAAIDDPERALTETITYWQTWASRCTYHGPYRDMVVRSALALKLLTHTPTGAIVAAPTTSLPEEIGGIRNWDYRFTWIRDASFTLYSLLLAGYVDEDDAFIDWIVRTVEVEGTGIKILYPITPAGQVQEQVLPHLEGYRGSAPVRIGNGAANQIQLDVYGEVLDVLHFAWKVGQYDPAPVWRYFRPLVEWVVEHWSEPESGIWEVRGGLRHFVYGKVMCWVALDRAIALVEGNGLPGDVERWRTERDRIRLDVLEHGWSERRQAFKQSYEDDRLDASNLLLPIVGFIEGEDPRMVSTIDATFDRMLSPEVYTYRYLAAPEGLTGEESAFVLCTFWLVDALILAGRQEEAQQLFEEMLAKATPLGLFAEEVDPVTGAHLGNFPQAVSHIGVINAAVSLAQVGRMGELQPEPAEAASRGETGTGGVRRTQSAERTAKPVEHQEQSSQD